MAKTFCVCCTLKQGTIICATATLILAICSILMESLHLARVNPGTYAGGSLIAEGVINIVTSILCFYGAFAASPYFLIPWLIVRALDTVCLFMFGIYYMLFTTFDYVLYGLHILVVASLSLYGWICVANFYSELKDNKASRESELSSTRSYISEEAVTCPSGFAATPPPSYTTAANNSAFEFDLPPNYADIIKEKKPEPATNVTV